MNTDQEILHGVLTYFRKLAQIPRPSGHEKAVSDFLQLEFQKLGCKVTQDEVYNLIADLPATAGHEDAPLTILQSHMDMVCVAEDGVRFDALHDAIKLQQTEEFLQAEGTSLGSDDGTGIAEILYLFATLTEHGPLRAIITVDEEVGMLGARALAAAHLADAKYLLNCDSEDYDILTVGSAGSVNMDFTLPLSWETVTQKGKTLRLTVNGLKGGHSGERIGDGRANALKVLNNLLLAVNKVKGWRGLVSVSGGVARNAIPSEAEMVFVTEADKAEIEKVLENYQQTYAEVYQGIDNLPVLQLEEVNSASKVMSVEKAESLSKLLLLLHSGVFAMSPHLPGLIETSANIGTLRMTDEAITMTYFPRSGVAAKLSEIMEQGRLLAELTGWQLQVAQPSPTWHEKADSKLAAMMTEIFAAQNSKPMTVTTIHAGLECGYHIEKNPDLDMVSIGVTTLDIHSPHERLVLSTVAPQVKLIAETLRRIAAEK